MTRRRVALGLAALGLSAGCGAPAPQMSFAETGNGEARIAALTRALLALGPEVDAQEAGRTARIAVLRPLDWAEEWQVVDRR